MQELEQIMRNSEYDETDIPKLQRLMKNSCHNSKLIVLSLFTLFLISSALAVYTYIQNQTLKNQLGVLNSATSSTQTCSYNGQTYQINESFPALDNCNTCFCGENGEVSCTEIACLDQGEESGDADLEPEGQAVDLPNLTAVIPHGLTVSPLHDGKVIPRIEFTTTKQSSIQFVIGSNLELEVECIDTAKIEEIQIDQHSILKTSYVGMVFLERGCESVQESFRAVWFNLSPSADDQDMFLALSYRVEDEREALGYLDEILSSIKFKNSTAQ